MCKIEIKKNNPVGRSCIRGFTRHYWFNSMLMMHNQSKEVTNAGKQGDKGTGSYKSNSRMRQSSNRERCEICGQTFLNIGNLNRHKKLHSDYNRIRCNVCHRTYSNVSNFKIHIPRHHATLGIEVTYSNTTEGAKDRPIYANLK